MTDKKKIEPYSYICEVMGVISLMYTKGIFFLLVLFLVSLIPHPHTTVSHYFSFRSGYDFLLDKKGDCRRK